MNDPVKRPAPIQERWNDDLTGKRALVLRRHGRWFVAWGARAYRRYYTFGEAIAFAHDDREIGACS